MFNCPECGMEVGHGTTVDGYKHIINCLHLPAGDRNRLRSEHANPTDEHGKRIIAALDALDAEDAAVRDGRGEY